MPLDSIGSRLRHYRRQRGLSQSQLADRSGVNRQTIAEMERGAVTIPREPDNIRALADALGIRMRDLAQPTGWYDAEDATDEAALVRATADDPKIPLTEAERAILRAAADMVDEAKRRAG